MSKLRAEVKQKKVGLVDKYRVQKIGKPHNPVDCIVLEFDDPIARVGIKAWAKAMKKKGYKKCAKEVKEKLSYFKGIK